MAKDKTAKELEKLRWTTSKPLKSAEKKVTKKIAKKVVKKKSKK
tara:strand:- start:379 stop:510 length:132 start_codon:yes stop_codon:yes gene_type:complete